jgi:hypothetical protein
MVSGRYLQRANGLRFLCLTERLEWYPVALQFVCLERVEIDDGGK